MNVVYLFYFIIRVVMVGIMLLAVGACSSVPLNKAAPLLLAHGASTGSAGYNSPEAVREALANPHMDGVEVDIVLTKDLTPVLAHDPWLDQHYCRRVDRAPMEYVLIRQVPLQQLLEEYECSYALMPYQKKTYSPLMPLKEFLVQLQKRPDFTIYLDMKIQDGLTHNERAYARVVSDSLRAVQLKNPLYIEVPTASAVQLFDQYISPDKYRSVISYPAFYAGENWTWVGVVSALKTFFFAGAPADRARKAGADMVMSPTVVMSKSAVRKLHRNAIDYGAFLIEDQASFNKACAYGPELLIVDYIGAGGCH